MIERAQSGTTAARGLRSVSLRYFNTAGVGRRVDPGGLDRHDQPGPLLFMAVLPRALRTAGDLRHGLPDARTGARSAATFMTSSSPWAHVRALEYLEGGGETTVLNLGTGVGASLLEVPGAAERAIGRPPVPHESVARRPGDPVALYADTARSKEVLGWTTRPRRDPDVGVGVAHDAHERVRRQIPVGGGDG